MLDGVRLNLFGEIMSKKPLAKSKRRKANIPTSTPRRTKPKRVERFLIERVIPVSAPPNWAEMFDKDPEGPEIQRFLNGVLQSTLSAERRATLAKSKKAAKRTRKPRKHRAQ
jgi:hypothetical protein